MTDDVRTIDEVGRAGQVRVSPARTHRSTHPEVVTIGECLVSLVAADSAPLREVHSLHAHVAGAEGNVAVGLARLGHPVAFIGRVGADGFGERIVRALRGEGVDVAGLTVDPDGPTGVMVRERRGVGPSEVIYLRKCSAGSRLGPDDVAAVIERGVFGRARWLHLTGVTPALSGTCLAAVETALAGGREEGLTVSLDVNLRRLLWSEAESSGVLRDLAARVDVLVADEDEATVVTGLDRGATPEALAAAILDLGPSLAVLKLGARGGLALGRDGEMVRAAGLPVATVVDPIGAGDAFSAGFIAARLEGAELAEALAWANAAGAAAISVEGDLPGLPTRRELERLLDGSRSDTLR